MEVSGSFGVEMIQRQRGHYRGYNCYVNSLLSSNNENKGKQQHMDKLREM